MAELFETGFIVDLIIGMVVIEAIILVIYRRMTGRGIAVASLLINLSAGLFLLVAVRVALVDGAWSSLAMALFAALIAHLGDLHRRWNT